MHIIHLHDDGHKDMLPSTFLEWLIGAVVCLLAVYCGSDCSLASAMVGRI